MKFKKIIIALIVLVLNFTQLLSYAKEKSIIVKAEQVTNPVEIVLLVDVSTSMLSQNKYLSLISALKQFSNLVFSNMSDAKIDLIEFSTMPKLILENCSDKDEFLEHIESDSSTALNHIFDNLDSNTYYIKTFGGGTSIGKGLEVVRDRVNNIISSDPDRKIYLINLTDGINTEQADSQLGRNILQNDLVPNVAKVYNILFGVDENQYNTEFAEYRVFIPNDPSYGFTNFVGSDSSAGIQAIYEQIWKDIEKIENTKELEEPKEQKESEEPVEPEKPEELNIEFKDYVEISKNGIKYLKNIRVDTLFEDIKKNIITNGKLKIIKENTEITDDKSVAITGEIIEVQLNNDKKTYIIIVPGDTNGDGKANIEDIFKINKHRLNTSLLEGAYLLSGDVNNDDKADMKDILKINKYRFGKISNLL